MKKTFLASLFLVAALSIFSFAAPQSYELSFNASGAPQLVRVDGNFSFDNLIPGLEYSSQVKVSWNVPKEALANLAEQKVVLSIKAMPRALDSWVYFNQDPAQKALSLELYCVLRDKTCAESSKLEQTITVYYKAPQDARYPHVDGMRFEASVDVLSQQQVDAEHRTLSLTLSGLESRITMLNENNSQTDAALLALLNESRSQLESEKFVQLNETIALLEGKIVKLEAQKTAMQAQQENETTAAVPQKQQNADGTTGFISANSSIYGAGLAAVFIALLLAYAVWAKGNGEPNKPRHHGHSQTHWNAPGSHYSKEEQADKPLVPEWGR